MKIRVWVVMLLGFIAVSSIASGDRILTLVQPVGIEVWDTGDQAITWQCTGASWLVTDTVTIEYDEDLNGTSDTIASGVPYSDLEYLWDVSALPRSPLYKVRVTCEQDGTVTAVSPSYFRIGADQEFYVNDPFETDDEYCSAAGSPTGNGASPSTPNTSIQYIIDTYNLEPGDTVWMDTGTYLLTSNITVGEADQGESGNPVKFLGSPHGTVVDRNAASTSSTYVFNITGSYVQVGDIGRPLQITNAYYGIRLAATGSMVRNCEIYGCGSLGIYIGNFANMLVDGCLVRDNTSTGVYFEATSSTGSGAITNNIVRNNSSYGIYAYKNYSGSITLSHNLVLNNGSYGMDMRTGSSGGTINSKNNTIVGNGSRGAYYYRYSSSSGACNFSNNVIHADGAGKVCMYIQGSVSGAIDYNTYYATGGANIGYYSGTRTTLGEWRMVTGRDANTLPHDPRFVDAANDDYHLKSTGGSWHDGAWTSDSVSSRAIDAGNASDAIGLETTPHGNRINQGVLGATAEASRTPVERLLTLLAPIGGEVWETGSQQIRWNPTGQTWTGVETLTIEYSDDNGDAWTTLTETASVAAGEYAWDVTGLISSPFYKVRITCNEDTSAIDTGNLFRVGSNMHYYVNDADTYNDFYCMAAGSSAADGASPSTPNTSVQYIINNYSLQPGDTVWIDTGYYPLSANITVGSADAGTSDNFVKFLGSPNGTVVDRNAASTSSTYVFNITGSYVQVGDTGRPLQITNAYYGIRLAATGGMVRNCEIYGCGSYGIYIGNFANMLVDDCLVRDNTGTGLYFEATSSTGSGAITNNIVRNNSSYGIYAYKNYSGSITLSHNLVLNNGSYGMYMRTGSSGGTINSKNNTIVGNGFHGAYYYRYSSSSGACNFSNNVIHADGPGKVCMYIQGSSSGVIDYNTYYATGGANIGYYSVARATLGEWRAATGQDANTLDIDPRFVNPVAGDYHLRSTAGSWHDGAWIADAVSSPAIDVGNPAEAIGLESVPNGNRINQGAYGATIEASRTPTERLLTLVEPIQGEVWANTGYQVIRWNPIGQAWTESDTVTIEYSDDAGDSWTTLATDAVGKTGSFPWEVTGLPASHLYQVRITSNEDVGATDTGGLFRMGANLNFYVNDQSTIDDDYCTGPGTLTGNGVSAGTANTSVQYIIDTYNLEPGDTVWIDKGYYPLTSTITVGEADQGASGTPVKFVGSPNGTILDRNAASTSSSRVFDVTGEYVQLGDTGTPLEITNAYYGIRLAATGGTVRNCEIYGCGDRGIDIINNANIYVEDCLVRDNTGTGLYFYATVSGSSVTATGNILRNNTSEGIYAYRGASGTTTLNHNLVLNNGSYGLYMRTGSSGGTFSVRNNTIVGNGSHAAYFYPYSSSAGSCYFKNNIIHTDVSGKVCMYISGDFSGSFDYNTYYATGGANIGYYSVTRASLGEWRTATGQDANTLNTDPRFVNPTTGDYHLMSTGGSWHDGAWLTDAASSPAIDAGDIADAVGLESTPNGNRINQGVYGATIQASRTPAERLLTLLQPIGGEVWATGLHPVRWNPTGQAWTGADTVTIEYTHDNGDSWTTLTTGAGALSGYYAWDITGLAASHFYRVRIISNDDGSAMDTGGLFRIGSNLNFYVNDSSSVDDVYCTAPGLPTADGASPETPNTSVQYIVNTYNLEAGDTVWIDTGYFPLSANITVGSSDSGSSGNPVKFVGSPSGTVLDRNNAGTSSSRVFSVTGEYVQVGDADKPLQITRAYYGISLAASGGMVRNCEIYGCGDRGIDIGSYANFLVENCLVRNNTGTGIYFYATTSSTGSGTITGNILRNNSSYGIYAYKYYSGTVTLSRNLVVNNGSYGMYMRTGSSSSARINAYNNTIGGNSSHGVYYSRYSSSYGYCNFSNNIIHADGSGKVCMYIASTFSGLFDYNTYYATGGANIGYYSVIRASLGEWRTATGQDANTLPYDPRFVDPVNGDYHLMSTEASWHDGSWLPDVESSPAIDGGNPADPVGLEICPNGDRINQGAFGGTVEASLTPGLKPTVTSISTISHREIQVVFSAPMDSSAAEVANYELTGLGTGTLSIHPDTIVKESADTYNCIWNSGEMQDGETITITVTNVKSEDCYRINTAANSGDALGIGILPSITVNSLLTRNRTPMLTGTVEDVDSGICSVEVTVNGYTYPADVTGNNWSVQVTDMLDGDPPQSYDVDASAMDCAGNIGLDPTEQELSIDIGMGTTVDAILIMDASPTNAATVHFQAVFSMPVFNVQSSHFTIDAPDGVTGATVTDVEVVDGTDNMNWQVTVSTGVGDGSLSIDLKDPSHTIIDEDGYPLAGDFLNGQSYAIDKTVPMANITLLASPITPADDLLFQIVFSETVGVSFAEADITPIGSLAAECTVKVQGGPITYQITLTPSNPEADGTLGFTIPLDVVFDLATNPYAGGNSPEYRVHNWRGFLQHPVPVLRRLYTGDTYAYQVGVDCGESAVSYQWQHDGIDVTYATTPNLVVTGAEDAVGDYQCVVTYDGEIYVSDTSTVMVADHLEIVSHPEGGPYAPGSTHTFSVEVQGGFEPLTYQWSKNGIGIPDANEDFYRIEYISEDDAGEYSVTLMDSHTDIMESNSAVLTVESAMPVSSFYAKYFLIIIVLLTVFCVKLLVPNKHKTRS